MEIDNDDDFVRTISDDEPVGSLSDENTDSNSSHSSKKLQESQKRKRGVEDGIDLLATTVRSAKRPRRSHTHLPATALSNDNGLTSADEAETWTAHGEDDGAMDSDFDFQIGDVDTGITVDFDGWGIDGDSTRVMAQVSKDKKGVDIDELIARRKLGAATKKQARRDDFKIMNIEDQDHHDDEMQNGSGVEIVIDHQDKGDGEDETLADDAFGMGATSDGIDEISDDFQEDNESILESDEDVIGDPMPDPEDVDTDASSVDEGHNHEEKSRQEAFFAPEDPKTEYKSNITLPNSFQIMSLSRPILRGLAAVGFTTPTPIQTKTIPVALLGKDVVGGAVTGSGKTAAFIIPILERLLYRPKKLPTSRVAILMPTRELAIQCFSVAKKLAIFTDITFCQLVGGFSLREQENLLRGRPDVIIATPGRFIDHMRNSTSFTVDTLEILVLDEADRMLEDGFADELNEILTTIPKSRQTMLFSATMTDRVDKLIRVGLNRPVRLLVDARKQTVGTLVQEFVRLRPGREDKRLGYLLYLCKNIYTERVIIFFRQKTEAHRVRIIFGLCGIKAAELHGSMSQEQRISSVESFRASTATHLLATDVASRGLDIKNVETVLNYEAPQSHEIYLHRVGRTARAGRTGRACTIAAEPDRKVVKQAVKAGKAQGAKIVSRVVEPTLADEWASKIDGMASEVDAILKEEKEEKLLNQSDMHIRRGENIITHEDEIYARPKRTWFETENEKMKAKKAGQEELNGRVGLGKGKSGGKLSGKDRKKLNDGRERLEGRIWKKRRGDGIVERGGKNKARGKEKGTGKAKGKGSDRGGGKAKGGRTTTKVKKR